MTIRVRGNQLCTRCLVGWYGYLTDHCWYCNQTDHNTPAYLYGLQQQASARALGRSQYGRGRDPQATSLPSYGDPSHIAHRLPD